MNKISILNNGESDCYNIKSFNEIFYLQIDRVIHGKNEINYFTDIPDNVVRLIKEAEQEIIQLCKTSK